MTKKTTISRKLAAAALTELTPDLARLELERWTTSRQDPATAIEQLIRRELYDITPTSPHLTATLNPARRTA
ncbi:hypothetical protein [Microcella sp.]|uniref:hypothetical protein n=1 Tax=Microcella sp. TaxID=1913979 RepID=UPI003918F6F1